jgi:Transglutaminase-like superfamily
LRVAATVCRDLVVVRRALASHPLPAAVALAGSVPKSPVARWPVQRLSRAVDRCLLVGPLRARCLVRAMVLYRLLRRQGLSPQVVIGLQADATGPDAHAWVEIDGHDVGPYPGRSGHDELVRYP